MCVCVCVCYNIKSALLSQLSPDKEGEVIKSTEEMLWRLRRAALFIHEEEGCELGHKHSNRRRLRQKLCSENARRKLNVSLLAQILT